MSSQILNLLRTRLPTGCQHGSQVKLDRTVPTVQYTEKDISFAQIISSEVVHVNADLRARLLSALQHLPSPYTNFGVHCSASSALVSSIIGQSHRETIHDFCTSPSATGVLLITGLPVDPMLPCTPGDGGRSVEKSSFISEACLTGISGLVGELFGIESEKQGEVIHNVCPVRRNETEQSNGSSKVNLSLHVENAYFDERPDFLALYCLRQDHLKEAQTSFVEVRDALAELSPEDIAQLQRPVFVVPSPPSHHQAMGGEAWSKPRPVIHSRDKPDAICHFPGMKGLDQDSQDALGRFEQAMNAPELLCHVALQPGNLLLINNRKVAHGRTLFKARYDGTDRWLQRVYIKA